MKKIKGKTFAIRSTQIFEKKKKKKKKKQPT